MRTVIATVAALALTLAVGAGAVSAASPTPGTVGLRLTPAPVRVDDTRTITATNLSGGLAVTVELVTSPGYVVEPASFDLADGASQAVTITVVDGSDGTLTATATNSAPGAVRSAVSLSTRLVHAGWLETLGRVISPALLVLLVLGAVAAVLGGLRIRHWREIRYLDHRISH